MAATRTRITDKQILNVFKRLPEKTRDYYEHFPSLLNDSLFDVSIAYLFMGIERAHFRALHCGLTVKHKADAAVTDAVLTEQRISRRDFEKFFKAVFGENVEPTTLRKLREAEKIRDKVIHGREPTDAENKRAIIGALEYIKGFAKQIETNHNLLNPFGPLTGVGGLKNTRLPKTTTRWVLKGMGFEVS